MTGRVRVPPEARRNVLLLAVCYALAVTSISLTIAASPVVGAALAPTRGLATIPVSLQVLGTMVASLPASLLMGRIGRRSGFLVGTTIGIGGAITATIGIIAGSFVLFCLGSFAIGVLNGFAQLYRFAAADVAGPSFRAKAISFVMAGGVVAGVLGPGLATGASDLVASARFAGSYATILLLYAAVAVTLTFVTIPKPVPATTDEPPRPLCIIAAQPRFVAAVVAGMAAYGIMALLMTATPLSMADAGHAFGASAFVIQAHAVSMFGPSFFTGSLIARFGHGRIMAVGLAAMMGTVAVARQGQDVASFVAALVLLGIGWNFLFVSGTDLMASLHTPTERAKVQGVNDLLVFGTAAASSFLAGYLQDRIGWDALNGYVAPAIVATAIILLAAALAERRGAAAAHQV